MVMYQLSREGLLVLVPPGTDDLSSSSLIQGGCFLRGKHLLPAVLFLIGTACGGQAARNRSGDVTRRLYVHLHG